MATPTLPPAPAPSGGGSNKILLGCGIGCGALVLVVLIAAGVFYMKVLKPMVEQTQAIEQAKKENDAALESLRALDSASPSSMGADLETVDLAASDVDTYLELRAALADEAAASAAAANRMTSAMDMGRIAGGSPTAAFGMMADLFSGAAEHQRTRGTLLRAAVDEFEAAGMGPTEFQRMLELVEWRFLRRDEALATALTATERSDWMSNKFQATFAKSILDAAGSQAGASDRAQFERQLETAEDRLDELREAAAERSGLSATTQRVLEARRAELQNLPAEGLGELASLSESQNPMEWLAGLQGGGFGP